MLVRLVSAVALAVTAFAPPSRAQDTTRAGCGSALNLGAACTGLSIGNSRRWNGLRLNFCDQHVERINGVNSPPGHHRKTRTRPP